MRRIVAAVLYVVATAAACQAPVHAADTGTALVASAAGSAGSDLADTSGTLQEVVVSARKRQEDAQSVPISIVAISGEQLEQSHAFLAGDIVQGIPDMNFQFINPRQTAFSIRGIGNNPANEGLETSIGLYLDGVYLSRPGMLTSDLLDIDHIEVLRGPQGTLFGKNTTAGAVNIITRGPENTFSAAADISGGNYRFLQERADVTGPLTPAISARLAVYHTGRDGTITDTTNGSLLNNENKTGARAQLLFDPGAAFTLRLIADWSHQQEDSGGQVLVDPGLVLANGTTRPNNIDVRGARFGYTPIFDPFARQVAIDAPQTMTTTNQGVSAEANWKFDGYTLTSITAWRNWTFYPHNDLDYLPLDIQATGGANVWNKQGSQELRLASPTGGAVDYVGGAYVYWQRVYTGTVPGPSFGADAAEYYSSPSLILPSYALNGVTSTTFSSTATRSYALFGQATWHVSSRWDWTAGVRSTYDDKDSQVARARSGGVALSATDPYFTAATAARNALAPPPARQSDRTAGNTISGMSSISFTPREGILLYATAARGAKSGGLNTSIIPAAVNPVVLPEIANSAELGIKSTFNRTLQVNVDVFWTDIRNYQTTIRDPILLTSYLANAHGVRSRGAELDSSWLPIDGLRLDAGVAYDEAIYTSFRNSPCPIEYSGIATLCDLSGKPIGGAPRWTGDLRAEYSHALAATGASGYAGAELDYRSNNYYTSDDSRYSLIPSYSVLNAHLGVRTGAGRWDVSLWVRNLLDRHYFTSLNNPAGGVFSSGYVVGSIGDPRTYGATIALKF
jgi:iron complex outermembrane receptor protein